LTASQTSEFFTPLLHPRCATLLAIRKKGIP
jgi:hypothetical protein